MQADFSPPQPYTAFLKKRPYVLSIGIGAFFLLLIGVVFSLSRQGQQLPGTRSKPASSFPTLPPETTLEGTYEASGTQWSTRLTADPGNRMWRENAPVDVSVAVDFGSRSATIAWTDPNEINTANIWLIGYHNQPFNPVEAFREENLSTISWEASIETPGQLNTPQTKRKTVTLTEIPDEWKNLYFYVYKRTGNDSDGYADYLYGDGESAHIPYSDTLVPYSEALEEKP